MRVSKLGRLNLRFIDARLQINGACILSWGASDLKATACHAWDLWRVIYLPARQCSRLPSLRDNHSSETRHLHSFHQTFCHPTAQIWTRLTIKCGEKFISGSRKFMTSINWSSAWSMPIASFRAKRHWWRNRWVVEMSLCVNMYKRRTSEHLI